MNTLATSQTYKKIDTLKTKPHSKISLYEDTEQSRKIIIKQIRNFSPGNRQERKKMAEEATILAKFDHPNIIECYHAGFISKFADSLRKEVHEYFKIEMEYAPLGSLKDEIRRRNYQAEPRYFTEKEIMNYFVQIAKAVREIHNSNIIHRDLKPDNIFMFDNGIVKVGDFGESAELETSDQTRNTLCGTPCYMAPEVFLREHSFESDIWSLGVILYELCTLKVPFNSASCLEVERKVIHENDLAPVTPMYSENLQHLLLNLLEKIPSQRPTIDEIFQFSLVEDAEQEYYCNIVHEEIDFSSSLRPSQESNAISQPFSSNPVCMCEDYPRDGERVFNLGETVRYLPMDTIDPHHNPAKAIIRRRTMMPSVEETSSTQMSSNTTQSDQESSKELNYLHFKLDLKLEMSKDLKELNLPELVGNLLKNQSCKTPEEECEARLIN
ncbi:unnamed protein product [Moneuplotes crassus]|uniref:non-specific serine/threonine protein kinase n=1 Tax=Euplotes crassus TaxID=5936 RepID=A0AAD1UI53_EUPCR|nr:unnamed protein product [Moneuplotes crassus]